VTGRPETRRRALLATLVMVLGAVGWAARAAVEGTLADGRVVDLGLLQLRLLHNPGVAFSFGAGLPAGVVAAGTGLVVLVIAGYAWRAAAHVPLPALVGLAAVLAGAITNLADRLGDGTVTDYFHTGWFATFNVPDVFISVGAVLVALTMATAQREAEAR
jgi:signal peptidase II